ncbi:tetratricopeptide repeat protein [Streptomyces coelicoflavus]|uniref:Tetratricopeptide repeat protein n=1 Tax=Streptomyces coelicoflavus TaxID=285562 RepID=A0A7K3PDQ2_9ACTN|nr:BTAD domain-containing putative transcriptional regulator [Streptomyces coelicoflavus]NEB08144.1 tetratricopeptide repeat protein [Streptomyces coelicoflavus]
MTVRFTVLGPVELSVARQPLPGTAPRHRAVLAYLLLHSGTVLGAEQLIEAMWGPTPPETARAQIHAAIAAVRRVLRAAGEGELLVTRPAGYVIRPRPGQLDLAEFTEEVTAARALPDPAAAAARIRKALSLWRGRPLADVRADYAAGERARLEERRLAAFEHLTDLELGLGRHEQLVDELTARVAAHPLRERLSGQLMLALYRAGRQSDALAVARALRRALAEQQGLDPGRTFVALEAAVLSDDPALLAPADAPPPGLGPQPPPRQANFLPYDTPDFTGRAAELEHLLSGRSGAGEAVTVSVIDGMAGIGKTTLAVHAGHRLAERYPDGQLFVDLQAHTPGQVPTDAGTALGVLLRQLGTAGERLPASATERAALWRAELAGRRVLVVLDNAAGTEHIRPLLPGATSSLLLITSRRRLTGLDGAARLSLDLLPAADALELFGRIVGTRVDEEPLAALDILHLCGFLPLAVRIAAARLSHRPQWSAAHVADRLRDQRRRLAELSTSERGVAAAFALSYQQLDPAQQRLFRLLGLHPGHDVDARAAGALAGIAPERAECLLEELLDAHMLRQHAADRYSFHDLLRQYAHATAHAQDSPAARRAALTRLFDHYVTTALAAVARLFPDGGQDAAPKPSRDAGALPPGDVREAAAWLETERANLVAAGAHMADHDWPAGAGRLAAALHRYLYDRGFHADAAALGEQALRVSLLTGDRVAQGRTLTDLAWLLWRRGACEQAVRHAARAAELGHRTGDRLGEAKARDCLGHLFLRRQDQDRAHRSFLTALRLFRDARDLRGEARGRTGLGLVLEGLGHYEAAQGHHRRALELYRELGDRGGEAVALVGLGAVHGRQGRLGTAHGLVLRAVRVQRSLGNRGYETEALNALGETALALGEAGQAAEQHRAALALADEVGFRPEQARAFEGLARAHDALGRPDLARGYARRARSLSRSSSRSVPAVGAGEVPRAAEVAGERR